MLSLTGVTLKRQWLEQTVLTIVLAIEQVNRITFGSHAAATITIIVGITSNKATASSGGHIAIQMALTLLRITDPRTDRGLCGFRLTTAIVLRATGVTPLAISREYL